MGSTPPGQAIPGEESEKPTIVRDAGTRGVRLELFWSFFEAKGEKNNNDLKGDISKWTYLWHLWELGN